MDEELWLATIEKGTIVTPEKFTVTYTKAPFRVTRTAPPGFERKQIAPAMLTNVKMRDGRLVMTKVHVAFGNKELGLIVKEEEEVSDFIVTHCK